MRAEPPPRVPRLEATTVTSYDRPRVERWRRALWLVLAAVGLSAAGCMGGDDEAQPQPQSTNTQAAAAEISPPSDFTAKATAFRVVLSWTPPAGDCRALRAVPRRRRLDNDPGNDGNVHRRGRDAGAALQLRDRVTSRRRRLGPGRDRYRDGRPAASVRPSRRDLRHQDDLRQEDGLRRLPESELRLAVRAAMPRGPLHRRRARHPRQGIPRRVSSAAERATSGRTPVSSRSNAATAARRRP